MLKYSLFLFICLFSLHNLKAEKSAVDLPVRIIKNQGQFSNGSLYCLKSAQANSFFFESYLVHQFFPVNQKDHVNNDILNIRIDFENSNPHPVFEERDPSNAKSNFFIGNNPSNWKTGIASFGTLAYKDIYHNVDLIYYSFKKGIKSDFVIHPGGNAGSIILKYSGINNIISGKNGDLLIMTDKGEISEHIPEAYQIIDGEKIQVNTRFLVGEDFRVSFEIENYNPAYDLVIDPQLVYCSYFGGSDTDQMFFSSLVKDSKGNNYFTCATASMNFPVTAGTYSASHSGLFDVAVVKLDPSARNVLFSTFIGGTEDDYPYCMTLSGSTDDIVVGGFSHGSDFPTTPGVIQETFAGGTGDCIVFKLNNSGTNLMFSTYLGTGLEDYVQDILVDASSNIYLSGYSSSDFPTTAGAYQRINVAPGTYDFFISKINAAGTTLLASTLIGGSAYDRGRGIAIDNSGNVYVIGATEGTFPTTAGVYDRTFNGVSDIVACKFNPTLTSLLFSTLIGGPEEDLTISSLILDNKNNLILTGRAGAGFPTTPGCFDQGYNGGLTDGIVIKLKNDGSSLLYSSYLGSPGNDFARDFMLNNQGNIVITGTCENGFPTTDCTYDSTFNGGGSDAFISVLDINSSQLLYSTYIGGNGDDAGNNMTISGDTILLAGYSSSGNLPVSSDAYDPSYNGGADIFLLKIQPGSGLLPKAKFSCSALACINKAVSFNNTSENGSVYSWNFGDGNTDFSTNPAHTFAGTGTYSVSLIAGNSCSSDTIVNNIRIDGFISADSVSVCEGDSILIFGIYHSTAGNYEENYLSTSGCDSIYRTRLAVINFPVVNLPDSLEVCYGQSVTLDAGVCQQCQYIWSDGSAGRYLSTSYSGVYEVKVTNSSCSTLDSVKVILCDLFMPNAFSPNADGLNDYFLPSYHGTVTSFQLMIFNRWGEKIFESKNINSGWDGMKNGNQCPGGLYSYLIRYTMGSENSALEKKEKRGTFTLLR